MLIESHLIVMRTRMIKRIFIVKKIFFLNWTENQGDTLMITSKVESDALKLWKRGKQNRRSSYPNFSQYVSMKHLKWLMATWPYFFVR